MVGWYMESFPMQVAFCVPGIFEYLKAFFSVIGSLKFLLRK
jgi:hypothetical protein